MTALRVRGLRYRYPTGSHEVLAGLDLDVTPGERVALLGPNGSGKTTLVHHVVGLLPIQSGTVSVQGVALTEDTLRDIRRRVGVVVQDPDDQLFMPTVRADVGFGPANLGVAPADRTAVVLAALAAVGASDLIDRHPHHLSGGEKRRVAIATVLAMQPDVLILDEPTSGLDPAGRGELARLLNGIGSTQIVVTHDLPFALACCSRAVVLDQGRIVADAPTRDVLADPALLTRHRLALPFGFSLSPTAQSPATSDTE